MMMLKMLQSASPTGRKSKAATLLPAIAQVAMSGVPFEPSAAAVLQLEVDVPMEKGGSSMQQQQQQQHQLIMSQAPGIQNLESTRRPNISFNQLSTGGPQYNSTEQRVYYQEDCSTSGATFHQQQQQSSAFSSSPQKVTVTYEHAFPQRQQLPPPPPPPPAPTHTFASVVNIHTAGVQQPATVIAPQLQVQQQQQQLQQQQQQLVQYIHQPVVVQPAMQQMQQIQQQQQQQIVHVISDSLTRLRSTGRAKPADGKRQMRKLKKTVKQLQKQLNASKNITVDATVVCGGGSQASQGPDVVTKNINAGSSSYGSAVSSSSSGLSSSSSGYSSSSSASSAGGSSSSGSSSGGSSVYSSMDGSSYSR